MKKISVLSAIILMLFTAVLLSSCSDGSQYTQNVDVSGFNQIQIDTFGEFVINQGNEESLSIEAPRDYLRYVTTSVDNGVLVIGMRRGFLGTPIQRVTFTLTVKDLNEVTISGAAAVKIYELNTDSLDINLTGAGSIEVDQLNTQTLDVNLTSAGAIVIAGQTDSQQITISGVGSYEAGDLRSNTTDILLTGAGSAVVWAEQSLDINVTGVGSVSYFGENPSVQENVSGLGSINSKGSHP
jgi:hypothetical protein